MKSKSIDFNSVLTGANLLLAAFIVLAFTRAEGNEYVNQETMGLGIVLSLQTHIALRFERRRRNPFIILLVFSMLVYYSLRLLTLSLSPFSVVFDRYPYDASDSNYALIFIIIANLFLYTGFHIVRFKANQVINAGLWRAGSPWRVVFLVLAAIVFAYFSGIYWTEDNVPRVFNFLTIFLSQNIVLLMTLSYYLLFKKSLTRRVAATLILLIVADMIAHTLIGSRGAIVSIIQNYILVTLAIASRLQFQRKYFILGVVLFPVVLALLIGSFAISTYNRANRDSAASLDVGRAFELAKESSSAFSIDLATEKVLPLIAARAGFFDFSAEIIAHRDQYRSVFNLSSYAKSIIDNILTPGFDVFDQPKISNALQSVYDELGPPSKERVTEVYHSDQFGMYGEFYALFGYASLPLFFLVAYSLKRVYVGAKSANPFVLTMKRVIVLFVFVRLLDSYGVDWTILETLPLVAAIYIYRYFFFSRPAAAVEPTRPEDVHLPPPNPVVLNN